MIEIPLQPVPSQSVKAIVGNQNCEISIYQKPQGVFVDVVANGIVIVTGIVARDAVPIVCREYTGFEGNLLFIDIQGGSDPNYANMGSRYVLVYMDAAEYALIQQ